MPIIDPNNRPQHPSGFLADIIRWAIKYGDLEEFSKDFDEFWNIVFQEWTYPHEIKEPRPYCPHMCGGWMNKIRMSINYPESIALMDLWQWEFLYETYTYPEYRSDY